MRSCMVLAGELMGFCIKVLENLLCSFNQLDHVSIKSQNNLQRFCRLLCLTSELINTRTHYIVGSFLGPCLLIVGWSSRLCSPNSALFRSTKQSDHIRGRPGAAGCGCQGGGGGRLEYFEPRLFCCKVYPNCFMYQSLSLVQK